MLLSEERTCRLDKNAKKCYNQNINHEIKGERAMKWVILGVVFAVVAIIRGNGIAFK